MDRCRFPSSLLSRSMDSIVAIVHRWLQDDASSRDAPMLIRLKRKKKRLPPVLPTYTFAENQGSDLLKGFFELSISANASTVPYTLCPLCSRTFLRQTTSPMTTTMVLYEVFFSSGLPLLCCLYHQCLIRCHTFYFLAKQGTLVSRPQSTFSNIQGVSAIVHRQQL